MNKKLISFVVIPLILFTGCFGPIGKETSESETVGISSVSLDTFTMLDTSSSSSTSEDSPTSLGSTSNSEQVTTSGKPNEDTSDSSNENETTNESSEPVSECGNGVIESEEKCDDGNVFDSDHCSNDCISARTIFLSKKEMFADFGGTILANVTCAEEAKEAGLQGVYFAWLSNEDSFFDPVNSFNSIDFKGWYILPFPYDDIPIAKGWKELTSDDLETSLNIQADGFLDETTRIVWTATSFSGHRNLSSSTCNNWLDLNREITWTGDPQSFSQYEWTSGQINSCDTFTLGKLYCVQIGE